jgi:hypothetical protein
VNSSDDEGGAFFKVSHQPPSNLSSNKNSSLVQSAVKKKIEEGAQLDSLTKCRHSLCVDCFTKYLETVVGQGNADDIKCPFIFEGGVDNSMIEAVTKQVVMDVC